MTKTKGQQCCLMVTGVHNAYRQRGNNYIHLLTFKEADGTQYIAEEMEATPVSKFIKNLRNNFTVTNPGINGNPDWVRFISLEGQPVTPVVGNGVQRENIFVAQTALNNAVLIGLQRGWEIDQMLDEAFKLAGNIKQIALQLQEEML